ncbi:hypothetical protein ACUNGX_08970, partial [Serratia sp. IR-2025]
DEDDAAVELFQEAFQPVDGLDIQVVGRVGAPQPAPRADQRPGPRPGSPPPTFFTPPPPPPPPPLRGGGPGRV